MLLDEACRPENCVRHCPSSAPVETNKHNDHNALNICLILFDRICFSFNALKLSHLSILLDVTYCKRWKAHRLDAYMLNCCYAWGW